MAALIRGWLCPWIAGPQVQTKSISSRSSAVVSVAPRALLTKNGAPPTERNARTGELTPPGMSWRARAKRLSETKEDILSLLNSVVRELGGLHGEHRGDTEVTETESLTRRMHYSVSSRSELRALSVENKAIFFINSHTSARSEFSGRRRRRGG